MGYDGPPDIGDPVGVMLPFPPRRSGVVITPQERADADRQMSIVLRREIFKVYERLQEIDPHVPTDKKMKTRAALVALRDALIDLLRED